MSEGNEWRKFFRVRRVFNKLIENYSPPVSFRKIDQLLSLYFGGFLRLSWKIMNSRFFLMYFLFWRLEFKKIGKSVLFDEFGKISKKKLEKLRTREENFFQRESCVLRDFFSRPSFWSSEKILIKKRTIRQITV